MQLQGWLFDLYPLVSSMILLIKGEDGLLHRFEDPFRPRFYAQGSRENLLALFCSLQRERLAIGYQWTKKREFWRGDEIEVMEIEMANPEHYAHLPRILPPGEVHGPLRFRVGKGALVGMRRISDGDCGRGYWGDQKVYQTVRSLCDSE